MVTGTDTGVGKTLVSAGLVQALAATYWKPVQAGLEDETDTETVQRLSGGQILPEAYRLALAASPHLAAEQQGVCISPDTLTLPVCDNVLVIEGAGGVLVPLNRQTLFVDVIQRWGAPVVLVARTGLGTINHTLLSLAALRTRGCHVAGVIFSGDEAADSQNIIATLGDVRVLGRLPYLSAVDPASLRAAFAAICIEPLREILS